MQIEKAYLFGRQMTAGHAPVIPEDIFFENGVFNSMYVPQGFNFASNRYELRSQNQIYDPITVDTFPSGRLTDGTTFFVKHSPNLSQIIDGENWSISNGKLLFHHVPSSPRARREYSVGMLIPVVNIDYTKYHYLKFDFTFTNTPAGSNSKIIGVDCFKIETQTTLEDAAAGAYTDHDYDDPTPEWFSAYLSEPIDFFNFYTFVEDYTNWPTDPLEFWIEISSIKLLA